MSGDPGRAGSAHAPSEARRTAQREEAPFGAPTTGGSVP